ncbi:MAG: methyltransferase domain-containing protein [Bacteroidia bacterium]|nr:class I SAM-dependent methyltransferase [Bacteroidales bacterium]NCD41667.1 methyltransferase domain-containing protein [Bacteroidia bacterium]MDD3010692.1 class I SAM-dependent methyltransferase [Bacteroidales bacterium]MDD3961342.1 class I SAM-dependent methyltransferase [Bacteroidales bacterium]MDY0286290.1 class I SAM-dependent methyltransferase [Bacteroidales bacterium]
MFKNDPLGKAYHDLLTGNQKGKILVQCSVAEDEWLDPEYFFRSFDQMPETEQTALNRARGKVLDAGAGSGSHTLWLQEQGLEVVAIDISPGAVECMNRRGVKSVRLQDIFTLKGEKFDTILMLMNGIGMVQDIDGLEFFLSRVKELLHPGGQILLDSSDLRYLFQEEDGSMWIDLNAPYYGEVEYKLEYNGVKGEPFKWLYVDYYTLDHYAQLHGFEATHLYEDDHFNYLVALQLRP